MAKQNPKSRKPVAKESKPIIPLKYQDYFYPGIIFLAVIIFLASAIFGEGFPASDNLAHYSLKPFVEETESKGEFPLWIPYLFSGMPSYASLLINGTRLWDFVGQAVFSISAFFGNIFGSDTARVSFFYILYGIGMYLLMRIKQLPRFAAFFTAFAAVFSTSVIVWIMIGHNTKPVVFSMFPFIFILIEKLRLRFSLFWAALLTLVLHVMIEAGHIQMIFYGMLAFGIYFIYELIARIIKKEQAAHILRPAAIVIVAGVIAFMMSADRYFSTMEYTDHSTRGTAPIVQSENTHQLEGGGHDYEYATMWSFSPQEMITFVIPNYFGFGKLDYNGQLSGGREIKLMSYWGQKPFEDAAPYMGILVLALAIVGIIYNRRITFVQFLIALSLFSLLLSFGYTLPFIYDLFYYNVPMFNKFRAPSMALALLQFAVPILAGYGISSIMTLRNREHTKSDRNILLGLLGGGTFLLLAGLIFSGAFQGAYMDALRASSTFQQYAQSGPQVAELFGQFVWDQMISDWYVISFILIAGAALIYLFAKNKVTSVVFFSGIFILLIFDLWRVAYRPMEVADVDISERALYKYDYIDYIKQDDDLFRVADFVSESPNVAAYFLLENVNGYHSAKLRTYQDMLDVTSRGSTSQLMNPFMWNLLNVKYILWPDTQLGQPVFQSRQRQVYVYNNPDRLERAFFVDSVKVEKPINILNNLNEGNFDPRTLAFVESELPGNIEPAGENATVNITKHEAHLIEADVNATGTNLLVLSEMYYEPGWKAEIDGKPADIHKTNYLLRSVIIPEGQHKLKMYFVSPTFEVGKNVSLGLNIFLAIALIAGFFLDRRKKKDENIHEDKEEIKS